MRVREVVGHVRGMNAAANPAYVRHYRGAGESVATGDGVLGGFASRVKGVGERHIRAMIASGTSSHARLASSTIGKCGAA